MIVLWVCNTHSGPGASPFPDQRMRTILSLSSEEHVLLLSGCYHPPLLTHVC